MTQRIRIKARDKDATVYDIITGREISHIASVAYHAEFEDKDSIPYAEIKRYYTEIDVETDAEIVSMCPSCRDNVPDKLTRITAKCSVILEEDNGRWCIALSRKNALLSVESVEYETTANTLQACINIAYKEYFKPNYGG